MKIVIEIPDVQYEYLAKIANAGKEPLGYFERVIMWGTPLPKGHGRLIDADALEYTCNSDECGMLGGCNGCQYHIITECEIDNAPTIIERSDE